MWEGVRKACLYMCERSHCPEPSRVTVRESQFAPRMAIQKQGDTERLDK